jgi:hypothetical protein
MGQAVRIIDLTKEDLIQLIKEAVPPQKCPPCEEPKSVVKEFLTRDETKQVLGVSFQTLNEWRKDGTLPASKIGKRVYYRRQDIVNRLTAAA